MNRRLLNLIATLEEISSSNVNFNIQDNYSTVHILNTYMV